MLGPLDRALGADGGIGLKSCSHGLTDALCSLSKVDRGGTSNWESLRIPIYHPQLFWQVHKEPGMLKNLLDSDTVAWNGVEYASDQVFASLRHWHILWDPAEPAQGG